MARSTFVGYREAATGRVFQQEKPNHFLLNEFATYAGEVVNPYTILKVSQEADRTTIRRAYVDLSKRYHPDGVRQRDVLPGKW
jgi:DnaJ-class molecular chaperone